MARRKSTTPTSDSINGGMHGHVPPETVNVDSKEVNMTNPTDIVIESDQEFEESLGSGDPQNEWKERLEIELKTWEDGTPSALKVITDPSMEGAATFGVQTIDAKTVANLILCDLRSGAYRDVENPEVLLKVPLEIAFARGNVPSVGFVRWSHSGDFGNYGQLNLYPDGWTEVGVYGGKLVPTWHVSAVNVAQAMKLYNNERDDRTKHMIRIFYRCEALYNLLSGVNIRIRIGGKSEEYIMSRYNQCWLEDDVTKANAAYQHILFLERKTYNRFAEQAEERRVLKNGGVIREAPAVQKAAQNGEAVTITSIDGQVLTVGKIEYPTWVWTYDENGHRGAIKELLGANEVNDQLYANMILRSGSTFEIAS